MNNPASLNPDVNSFPPVERFEVNFTNYKEVLYCPLVAYGGNMFKLKKEVLGGGNILPLVLLFSQIPRSGDK